MNKLIYIEPIVNPKVFMSTVDDGNKIYDRKWFKDNIGKKIKRIDEPKIDTRESYKKIMKITNELTWQNVTVAEELYEAQFGWDFRYKLIDNGKS